MDENKQNRLPPIIVNYIESVRNARTPLFNREIYVQHLVHIRDACEAEIRNFEVEKAKYKAARR